MRGVIGRFGSGAMAHRLRASVTLTVRSQLRVGALDCLQNTHMKNSWK